MHFTLRQIRTLAGFLVFLFGASIAAAASGEYFAYIGTYTRNRGKGIYTFHFRPATGQVTTALSLAAETPSPSFLVVHPNRKFLYAQNEHDGEDKPGKNDTVSAFAINPKTGALTPLNRVSTRGEGPAQIAVDKNGKALLAPNYRSGSLALLPIQADGRLGEVTGFAQHQGSGPMRGLQDTPHPHGSRFSPDARFALVADRGIDEVLIYRYDQSKGTLTPNDPPFYKATPGVGPRHVEFHPNGRFLYALNEMGCSVTVLEYGAAGGTMKRIQEITTLPPGFNLPPATATGGRPGAAQLHFDRAGRFLYTSTRGPDTITVFAVDPAKGTLTLVENVPTLGKTPRDFDLDPTGGYLFAANQNSDNVVLFRVDSKTGRLTPTGQVVEHVPEPSGVLIVQAR